MIRRCSPVILSVILVCAVFVWMATPMTARTTAPTAAPPQPGWRCDDCAVWNTPQKPFRIFGNTWYVGTHGLSAILITSEQGHILVDAALPESVPLIAANIRELGFKVEDIDLIVMSHVHFDHAGGVGGMQTASGARVASRAPNIEVLRTGRVSPADPQLGLLPPIATVPAVTAVEDGEQLRVGPLIITAHATPGHTPGGTSWSWRSCEGARCVDIVYADSVSAVSADGFLYTKSSAYPTGIADFERSFATLRQLPCDILLTPHPDASALWARMETHAAGATPDPLFDRDACRAYADGAAARLQQRIARERGTPATRQP